MAEEKVKGSQIVLSFQNFSIADNGGGSRILRRLIEEKQENVLFFSVVDGRITKIDSSYKEIKLGLFPSQRKWMRSYLRDISYFLRNTIFFHYNKWRIQSQVEMLHFDVLHIVDHGNYSNILTEWAVKKNIPIWASFHDHFKTTGGFKYVSRDLWKFATKRMVISKEMGALYSDLFGEEPYSIVTDGLKELEISSSKSLAKSDRLTIYFAGLIHIAYYPLFKSFCSALEILLKQKDIKISFILRGTQKLEFLNACSFDIDYRPFTLDNDMLKEEMNGSDVLYLPIMYKNEYFYKYSFSTKMVGYLGASGNVFYHGPGEAAAANFLERYKCGVICDSLEPTVILEKLLMCISDSSYSSTAKKVAEEHFSLKNMQQLFWA
ncbi:MAG: hypothetical protein JWP81_5301 [Ferruginibacter sp.]|nr:hypothetical protein [Ferruginibacter sp.]